MAEVVLIFVSGGIDSSLIAYPANQSVKKIRTYNISIVGNGKNNLFNIPIAKKIADYLGTDHSMK